MEANHVKFIIAGILLIGSAIAGYLYNVFEGDSDIMKKSKNM